MDHDSIPSPDCHGLLVTALETTEDVALAACQPVIEPQANHLHGLIFQKYRFVPIIPSLKNDAWYECDAVITSGSLLSIPRINRLKIVDESLFIDAVDHDLCWRIRSAGLKIVVVKDALMSHQLGMHKSVRDRLKKRMIQLSSYSHLRLYYICRNHTYVEIKAAKGLWKFVAILWRVRFCLWQIRMNQLEGEQALKKSIFCLVGLLHGLLGRTGKHPLSSPQVQPLNMIQPKL
jgi:rhamnosyltransferase